MKFWQHWQAYMAKHPAALDATSGRTVRVPVGLSGDDAKYTLSGSKFLMMQLNSILHEPDRSLD